MIAILVRDVNGYDVILFRELLVAFRMNLRESSFSTFVRWKKK